VNIKETLGGGLLVSCIGIATYLLSNNIGQRVFIKKDLSITDSIITADKCRFYYEENIDTTKRTIRLQIYRKYEAKPYITKKLYPIDDFVDLELQTGENTLKLTQLGQQPIVKKKYKLIKLKEIK
jgi:hypothetical protein